jgi:hypothetical protein
MTMPARSALVGTAIAGVLAVAAIVTAGGGAAKPTTAVPAARVSVRTPTPTEHPLTATFARLDEARVPARVALQRARTPAGQRRIALKLAAAYEAAANTLQAHTTSGDAAVGTGFAAGLSITAEAYSRLAAAVHSRARFMLARSAVDRAESALVALPTPSPATPVRAPVGRHAPAATPHRTIALAAVLAALAGLVTGVALRRRRTRRGELGDLEAPPQPSVERVVERLPTWDERPSPAPAPQFRAGVPAHILSSSSIANGSQRQS